MRPAVVLILLLAGLLPGLFGVAAPAAAADAPGARIAGSYHALVIGINDYTNLRKLKTAVGDARAVAALLGDKYGFKTTLLENATEHDIFREIGRLTRELTENDRLLIYYAGHGDLDEAANRGYWQPVDAEPNIKANWISNADVTDALKSILAWHILVVADSCYSGSLLRSGGKDAGRGRGDRLAFLDSLAARKSRTALTSGGEEPVQDAGGGGHSVFAQALLEVLGENDDVLEGQELHRRLGERMAYKTGHQSPEYAVVQDTDHGGGDFLFVPRGWTPEKTLAAGQDGDGGGATAALSPEQMSSLERKVLEKLQARDQHAAELAVWQEAKAINTAEAYRAFMRTYCTAQKESNLCPYARMNLVRLAPKAGDPVTDCDRYAADPRDPGRNARDGIDTAHLAGNRRALERADTACRASIKENPDNPRIMYQFGRVLGASRRYEDAAFWYGRAADKGYVAAQYALGLLHLRGNGVRQSVDEAVAWFAKAAERDFPPSLTLLGILHGRGHGVRQDVDRALVYLRRAAQADPPEALAQLELGIMFEEGRGGRAPDLRRARDWYARAAAAGNAQAKERLARLGGK
ncbi:MAG: SEL1-like repeat protein [Hyphomicrobiales bacterium]|nr:SEL1-like repeat protein [Hyphomicrobiales bacterium]MCP5372565.1 SEL1-like repeat protein [Hyphomicrobiales bacterium]